MDLSIKHEIKDIPLESIEYNSWNPNSMNGKAYQRLLKEIRNSDFISAIQVVELTDGKYRVIGGEHRARAARELGYKSIPCVILSDAQFKSEDVQKFLTVRLNMLTGDLDPDKFRILYDEMVDKYGDDALQDLFGVSDDETWLVITKAIRRELLDAGIPKDKLDEAFEALGDDKSIEGLSRILNGIFSDNADLLNRFGYMIFDFKDTKLFFVDVSREVFKFFDELQIKERPDELSNKLKDLLKKTLELSNGI